MTKAIDGWVNVKMPRRPAPWQIEVAKAFKQSPEELSKRRSPDELVEMMDAAGVSKAIITLPVRAARAPDSDIIAFCEKYPERFALRALVDPRQGMPLLRTLVELAKSQPLVVVAVLPCLYDLPPNDKAYYPLYSKCCELELPVSINTGIPGPPLPGRCQDPMHLDEVCLFFPELTIVMANGADPWWALAIRLMLKYRNLYLMTSACAPKYLPSELLSFMNTRGRDKVLFGSDFPFLTMQRCLDEARQLDLREGILERFAYENSQRIFFERALGDEAAGTEPS